MCKNNICTACPANKPYYDSSTKFCGDCRSDNDCGATQLCLNNNSSSTTAGYNLCKTYSYDVILTTDSTPDNSEWIRPKVNNSPYMSYFDAEKICTILGRTMALPDDLLTSWNPGYHTNNSQIGILIKQKDGHHHTWVQGTNENGAQLIINMGISDTRAHIYYYSNLTAGFYVYCK